MDKKIIGIIGGMGPMATADLFYKIIELTDADTDSGHIHILIDNNTQIPDRTTAILNGDDSPLHYLEDSAEKLHKMGADFIIIPCNTSHYFYDRLCSAVDIPVVNMIEQTAIYCKEKGYVKVGLFATEGTVKTGVYKSEFQKHGIDVVTPDESGQQAVTDMIYKAVKAGKKPQFDGVTRAADEMNSRGAEVIILGCTELPIAFKGVDFPYEVIDPSAILAKSAVKLAGYRIKSEVEV